MIEWPSVHASAPHPPLHLPPPPLMYSNMPPHMRTNRTCDLVLVLLLIGARLALSPTRRIAALHTAMAMAMAMATVVTDDDVGLVGGDS